MDQSTLDRLRKELEDERQQQLDVLETHGADPYGEEVKDLQIANEGFADSAQATEERSEILALIDASRTRLAQVERALTSMDQGTYGVCESCGQQIQDARLEARPLSVRCVDCASKD
jgi:RNA polymerase-binding protein DksA